MTCDNMDCIGTFKDTGWKITLSHLNIALINHKHTNNLIPIQKSTEACTNLCMCLNSITFIVTAHKFSVKCMTKYTFESETTYRKPAENTFKLYASLV